MFIVSALDGIVEVGWATQTDSTTISPLSLEEGLSEASFKLMDPRPRPSNYYDTMHTAQLLSQALDLSRRAGYQVREEALEGAGGGHCLIRGQKWLLLDLTQTQKEQLNDVLDALRTEPMLDLADASETLVEYLRLPRAA